MNLVWLGADFTMAVISSFFARCTDHRFETPFNQSFVFLCFWLLFVPAQRGPDWMAGSLPEELRASQQLRNFCVRRLELFYTNFSPKRKKRREGMTSAQLPL